MMKLYNFNRLIDKYSVEFCLHKTQGCYDAGKWVQGGALVEKMRGAIVPLGENKIYSSGGVYTAQDRELYLKKPLTGNLDEYNVVYKGNTYTVESVKNFEDYADAAIYVLKWVSSFKDGEEHC